MVGSESRRISAELHIAAQCIAHSHKKFGFISDVYSSKFELEAAQSKLTMCGTPAAHRVPAVLHAELEALELSRIVSVAAKPGVAGCAGTDGETRISVPVEVEALYITNDGAARAVAGRFNVEASAADIKSETGLKFSVKNSGEVYGAGSDSGIEVRVPLEVTVFETTTQVCSFISGITIDENEPVDNPELPSLVIARVAQSDSLWTLAKRYHSTRELIAAANELEEGTELPGVLVIPKKR